MKKFWYTLVIVFIIQSLFTISYIIGDNGSSTDVSGKYGKETIIIFNPYETSKWINGTIGSTDDPKDSYRILLYRGTNITFQCFCFLNGEFYLFNENNTLNNSISLKESKS